MTVPPKPGQLETMSSAEICPDTLVTKKKLKLSLRKKRKGRPDLESSEHFTFIDVAKVMSLKKHCSSNLHSTYL